MPKSGNEHITNPSDLCPHASAISGHIDKLIQEQGLHVAATLLATLLLRLFSSSKAPQWRFSNVLGRMLVQRPAPRDKSLH